MHSPGWASHARHFGALLYINCFARKGTPPRCGAAFFVDVCCEFMRSFPLETLSVIRIAISTLFPLDPWCAQSRAAIRRGSIWQPQCALDAAVANCSLGSPIPSLKRNSHDAQAKCIGQSHEIVPGDTCVSIAATYNMTVPQLKALNPGLRDCANLPLLPSVCIGRPLSPEISNQRLLWDRTRAECVTHR